MEVPLVGAAMRAYVGWGLYLNSPINWEGL